MHELASALAAIDPRINPDRLAETLFAFAANESSYLRLTEECDRPQQQYATALRGILAALVDPRDELNRAESGGFGYSIAEPGGGVDDAGLAEFASEAGDGDPDGVGEWVDVLVPGLREELLCAECAGAGFEQCLEHGTLFCSEFDRSPVAGDGAGEQVEFDPGGVRVRVPAVGLRRASARMRRTSSGKWKGLGR